MTDLTQFYGDKGVVIDDNYAFSNTSKSNADLINEMRSHGLLVDFLEFETPQLLISLRFIC